MAKKTQKFMVWLLPVVVIGGLFWPPLGFLVFGLMLFMLVLAVFRGRYWCGNLCPRGAFLDLVLSRFVSGRAYPRLLTGGRLRWPVVILFFLFFAYRLATVPRTLYGFGFLFVQMCLLTTILAIIMGLATRARAWCVICPMGTIQAKLGARKRSRSNTG